MSSVKSVLKPFRLFDNETLNASKTTAITDTHGLDVVLYYIKWSGGAAINATVDIESLVYEDTAGNQTFEPLNVDPTNALHITGISGNHQLVLNGPVPLRKIRLAITHIAGTANLTVYVSGKGN